MADRILCSLEIVGEGMPHWGSRLEARARWWGFSVWFWNEHLCRRGAEIGRSYGRFDARELATIILDYDTAWRLFSSRPCDPEPAVLVTGEDGLKAQLLRLAFTRGSIECDWLMHQSAASFDILDRLIGEAPSDGWWDLVLDTSGRAIELGHRLDFPALLRRYGLATPDATLRDLYDALRRDSSAEEVAERKRRDALVPWADQIELIVRAYEHTCRPYRVGVPGQGQKEAVLRRHAEDYALTHGRLPTGRVRLPNTYEVDFDMLTAKVALVCASLPLPKSYRLPRHEREPAFRSRIEALVAAFDDRFVTEHGPDSDWQWWLERFLCRHAQDYERLPSGRMRVASGWIPLSRSWYDFGEVDFDALRQAAGLADDLA